MTQITLQFLSLDDIKAQARIEADFHDEDDYLMLLGRAAERNLLNSICRSYEEVVAEYGDWPEDLTLAALMLTSHWYNHHEPAESVTMSVVPYTYDLLYMPYRKGTYSSVKEEDE